MNSSKYKYVIETEKESTKFIVYKATTPSKRIYIGITTQRMKTRITEHVSSAFTMKRQYPFARSIRKYGINNIKFSIIDYANSLEELYIFEQYWIKELNTCINDIDSNGLNITRGGAGSGDAVKQFYINHPEKVIEVSNKLKEYFKDREHREKHSISTGGRPFFVYNRFTGEYVGRWINCNLCTEDLNLHRKPIQRCLTKESKYSGDYIFIYEDDYSDDELEIRLQNARNNMQRLKLFNVYKEADNSFIMTSNNQAECARILGLDSQYINKCLRGKNKQHKGHLFYYPENDPNLITQNQELSTQQQDSSFLIAK